MRRTFGQNEFFPLDKEQDVTFKFMIVLCAHVQLGLLRDGTRKTGPPSRRQTWA